MPPDELTQARQRYEPDTGVLITELRSPTGLVRLTDALALRSGADLTDDVPGGRGELVRSAVVLDGSVRLRVEVEPRGGAQTWLAASGLRLNPSRRPDLQLHLRSNRPLSGLHGTYDLKQGDSLNLVLSWGRFHRHHRFDAETMLQGTAAAWRRWMTHFSYEGLQEPLVRRAAITLKLCDHWVNGSLVAAPTSSLPAPVGGVRNWDYRYTWIRDAAFTVYAFLRVGFTEEATRFRDWLTARYKERDSHCDGPLQLMYAVDGRSDLAEEELTHLDGYAGSRPVRVGNAAHGQLQLDIYGELMDAAYLHNKYAAPVGYDSWRHLRDLVDWVASNWGRQDEGVWEVRGGRRHFVYSKFMCWVALDRGLRLADKRSFPADRAAWLKARDAIYKEVMARGWNEARGAFVQSYGSDALDASALLMPLSFFMAPNDPRMLATVDAIRAPATRGGLAADGLVYRYDPQAAPDGLPGVEGTFNMCSFWLVEALTRAGRTDPARLAEARLLFEQMLGYGNHLGLYAEQTGPSGEALGNFPQAFTHLALISAAFNLDRALAGRTD